MTTLKDVAKLAKVDSSTVSRVINNDPSLVIREDTRRRILKAVEQLNYRPNAIARSLKTRHTMTLGMLIPDITNPVYAEIIKGAEQGAAEEGYHLLLCNTDEGYEKKRTFISLLIEGRVDGLILANALVNDEAISEVADSGLPLVLVNRKTEGVPSFVVLDDREGGKVAVRHLVELGHRNIGHLSGPLYTDTGLGRLQGYRMALDSAGITFDSRLMVESDYKEKSGYEGMNQLLNLDAPPTAVFAANIMVALGALRAIKERRKNVPGDISLVGFHDIPFASQVEPPLTTVRMPLHAMGMRAAQLVIWAIQGQKTEGVVVPDCELIVRGSTGPVR